MTESKERPVAHLQARQRCDEYLQKRDGDVRATNERPQVKPSAADVVLSLVVEAPRTRRSTAVQLDFTLSCKVGSRQKLSLIHI